MPGPTYAATCQRHIAEIMNSLGAQNRLHAGYLVHDAVPAHRAPAPTGPPGHLSTP